MANYKGDLNVDIGAKLSRIERALDEMQRDFRRSSDRMKRESKRSGAQIENSLGGSFKRIAGLAAGAFATDQLLRFGYEAVQLAGKLEGVELAFNQLNKPGLLDELREATRGTITDLELMQKSVRANNFKIPLDQLATYFKFATDRAAQTGEQVDYLVNSIVDGIGRKSTLVLDNLGISASELQQEVKKVGDFGNAVGNIIQRQMGEAGDSILTTAQKTQALNAEFTNLKTTIGQQLTPAYNDLLKAANTALGAISDLVDFYTHGMTKENIEGAARDADIAYKRIIKRIKNAKHEQVALQQWIFKGEEALAKLVKQKKEYARTNVITSGQKELIDRQISTYEQILQKLRNYNNEKTKEQENLKKTTDAARDYLEVQHKILQAQAILSDTIDPTRQQAGGSVNPADGQTPLDFPTFDPELEEANRSAGIFLEQNKAIGESINQNTETAQMFFGVLVGAFQTAGNSSVNFAEKMSNAIKDLLVQVTTMILKMLALKAILSAFGVPTAGIGLGSFGGLGIPRFAQGGMVTGPTLAMVGDNPSGKEAIIPFEKMGAFLGQYGGNDKDVNVTGALIGRGEDLIVTIDKTENRRQNFYKG